MNAIYNEYMSESERDLEVIITESDAQIAKLNVLLSTVNGRLEANMLAAEAKVLAEDGTYDDLTSLYTEATTEANNEKENIFQKLFRIIKNFLNKVRAFFTGRPVEDKDIPTEMTIDKDIAERVSIIDSAWEKIQGGFNKLKNKDLTGAWSIIKGITGGLMGAVGTAAIATGAVTWKHDQIKSTLEKYKDRFTFVDNLIKGLDWLEEKGKLIAGQKGTDTEEGTGILGFID
jgi:hypothetical protein